MLTLRVTPTLTLILIFILILPRTQNPIITITLTLSRRRYYYRSKCQITIFFFIKYISVEFCVCFYLSNFCDFVFSFPQNMLVKLGHTHLALDSLSRDLCPSMVWWSSSFASVSTSPPTQSPPPPPPPEERTNIHTQTHKSVKDS